jgi:hypothetical protein
LFLPNEGVRIAVITPFLVEIVHSEKGRLRAAGLVGL